ncbi:UNVERIFIED_CONTAM: hypothetical protein GTU68_010461 [Idotea baltica]|nr:hypothetical protein [Idotea baltica]
MEALPTALDGVIELIPQRHGDARGWFSETWNQQVLQSIGLDLDFVQDNESLSSDQGTLRGIHYQLAPHAQDKLVRVVSGAILDVAVDLRANSPSFGSHVAVELSAERGNQLLVPKGFGHAFCTLVPNCHVAYKVTGRYSPECDRSLQFDDPQLGIDWPVTREQAVVSDKDLQAPLLGDADVFD